MPIYKIKKANFEIKFNDKVNSDLLKLSNNFYNYFLDCCKKYSRNSNHDNIKVYLNKTFSVNYDAEKEFSKLKLCVIFKFNCTEYYLSLYIRSFVTQIKNEVNRYINNHNLHDNIDYFSFLCKNGTIYRVFIYDHRNHIYRLHSDNDVIYGHFVGSHPNNNVNTLYFSERYFENGDLHYAFHDLNKTKKFILIEHRQY